MSTKVKLTHNANIADWRDAINDSSERIGSLFDLHTNERNSLVGSINELRDEIGNIDDIDNDTIVDELNSIHNRISDFFRENVHYLIGMS